MTGHGRLASEAFPYMLFDQCGHTDVNLDLVPKLALLFL